MYLRAASTYMSVLTPVGSLEVSFVYWGKDSNLVQDTACITDGRHP